MVDHQTAYVGPHFTASEIAALEQAAHDAGNLHALYDRCEACGVRADGYRALTQAALENYAALRQHFIDPQLANQLPGAGNGQTPAA